MTVHGSPGGVTLRPMRWCSVANNGVGAAGAEALLRALQRNVTLRWLALGANEVDVVDIGRLRVRTAVQQLVCEIQL